MTRNEVLLDLVPAVREMRRLQREYFAKRDAWIVGHCKGAEAKVDKMLSQLTEARGLEAPPPPSLLDYMNDEAEPALVGVGDNRPALWWADVDDD
jgi:hypothetical protein